MSTLPGGVPNTDLPNTGASLERASGTVAQSTDEKLDQLIRRVDELYDILERMEAFLTNPDNQYAQAS